MLSGSGSFASELYIVFTLLGLYSIMNINRKNRMMEERIIISILIWRGGLFIDVFGRFVYKCNNFPLFREPFIQNSCRTLRKNLDGHWIVILSCVVVCQLVN